MKRSKSLWIGAALFALAAAACSSTEAGTPALVSLTARSQSITVGDTVTVVATVYDGEDKPITNPTLSWSSSEASVASVDDKGKVKALAAGTSIIKATSGGASGTIGMIVTAVATGGD